MFGKGLGSEWEKVVEKGTQEQSYSIYYVVLYMLKQA